jgi:hypothetical protein
MPFYLPDDEDPFEWRPKPNEPYRRPEAVLWLPEQGLNVTISMLRQHSRFEAACFWYGLRDGAENGFVKAVVAPFQLNRRGNYHIPSASISVVSTATRSFGWVCLAQVHSHPGSFVEHSRYDDENANSQRILSVVIPSYGKWRELWPKGVGVHEYQSGYWHQLSYSDAALRIQLEHGGENITFIDKRK